MLATFWNRKEKKPNKLNPLFFTSEKFDNQGELHLGEDKYINTAIYHCPSLCNAFIDIMATQFDALSNKIRSKVIPRSCFTPLVLTSAKRTETNLKLLKYQIFTLYSVSRNLCPLIGLAKLLLCFFSCKFHKDRYYLVTSQWRKILENILGPGGLSPILAIEVLLEMWLKHTL